MEGRRSTPLEDRTNVTVKKPEITLEIGPPERQPDEDFEDYKERRKRENASIKRWLKGRPGTGRRKKS